MDTPTDLRVVSERARAFLRDESGQTAIEYGLIITVIIVAALAGYKAMGNATVNLFTNVANTAGKAM